MENSQILYKWNGRYCFTPREELLNSAKEEKKGQE